MNEPRYLYMRHHKPILDEHGNTVGWEPGVLSRGGVAVAYVLDKEEPPGPNGDIWQIYKCAVARCCPKDNFNKLIARAKAGGRLFEHSGKHLLYVEVLKSDPRDALINRIKNVCAYNYNLPVEVF